MGSKADSTNTLLATFEVDKVLTVMAVGRPFM